MERKPITGIMLTLLLISMLTLAFNIQPIKAEPNTWTVDDDGPADFSTIQEAINAASQGDTIFVYNGTYYENVVIYKTVSLIGENRERTVIDGNYAGTVVKITADYVNINAFTIQNGGPWPYDGIRLYSSIGSAIQGNIIKNNCYGIGVLYSSDGNISGNSALNNDYGIYIWGSSTNVVSDNMASSNWCGIYLDKSNGNTIFNNTVLNNVEGIFIQVSSNNIINGNTADSNNEMGISLAGASYNDIASNTASNNYVGIYIGTSTQNTIRENTIVGNAFGIRPWYSSNGNSVFHNNFITNTIQADSITSTNVWDDGYPSGGNYWSDHVAVDDCCGINQDELGSDGIVDEPYIIDDFNRDNYPLVEPWSPEPPSPMEALEELIQTAESWNLGTGIETSLTSKLQAAHRLLDKGKQNAPVGQLRAFMNEVEALRLKKLTIQQADQLIAEAQRIIDLIKR